MFFPFRRKKQARKTKKPKDIPKQVTYNYEHASELSTVLESSFEINSPLEKAVKDTFTIGMLAGLFGTVVMHFLSWIWKSIGLIELTTLKVSAAIFLAPNQINTVAGLIVGILAHIMVGSAGGILLAYFMKILGKDFFWLKGLGLAGFMLLVGMGLIVRIMDITPQMRADSILTLIHFINYFVYGLVVSYIIYKFGYLRYVK